MRKLTPAIGLVVLALLASGCGVAPGEAVSQDSAKLAAREARLAQKLSTRDSTNSGEPVALWVMPKALFEISGIALTPDQRMFGHNDERAAISEIDYRKGFVVKQFLVGKKNTIRGDFEAMSVVGDRFFLLTSKGEIFEFREGKAGERVDFTAHDTKLGKECEFEGLGFDPAINSLLLACKHVLSTELQGSMVIYRWNISEGVDKVSTLSIPIESAKGSNGWKDFEPSDITVDPAGNYVVIASQQQGMVVLTPAGVVVSSRSLPAGHEMAEGVAVTKDSILIISDEATKKPAAVTLYRWP